MIEYPEDFNPESAEVPEAAGAVAESPALEYPETPAPAEPAVDPTAPRRLTAGARRDG